MKGFGIWNIYVIGKLFKKSDVILFSVFTNCQKLFTS